MRFAKRYYSWLIPAAAVLAVFIAVGCSGVMNGGQNRLIGVSSGFEGTPDNCTACHFLWAERFDYFHGWDRYGYLYGAERVVAPYDPWLRSDLDNMYRKYYATDWWESAELHPWPEDVARNVESLSVVSHAETLPTIPATPRDVHGTVHIVAPAGEEYAGIQDAVDDADFGDTVFVRAGEYNETIELKNGVNLVGEDAETTIINPRNRGHAIVAANNSLIARLTLTGTGIEYDTGDFNAAIYVAGCDSTCVIAENIFRENGLFGVWIDGVRDTDAYEDLRDDHGARMMEMIDPPFESYPNPIIAGNTFYRIGQRGVFCVHARGEIFNNIFSGNVKAVGLEYHSRPLFHHNICYFNNVPMAANRSEPLVFNNIMMRNQWGQRMLRGANPVIFDNITWNSPFFRDFDEEGVPVPYPAHPGGNRELNPGFADPLAGDFTFSDTSALKDRTTGFGAMGIMRDDNLPQPPPVAGRNSYGREVLSMTAEIVDLIEAISRENDKINSIEADYTVTYRNLLDMEPDEHGDPEDHDLRSTDNPVAEVEYTVTGFGLYGSQRYKNYTERASVDGRTTTDSGRIVFGDGVLTAESGRFTDLYTGEYDPGFIGERPFRETPGGFYRDYDQYLRGAMGPTGTFVEGYLRIMGGIIEEGTVPVDGHECIAVRYPHIGKDQYIMYYLDPAIGYRPRKIEQYFNEIVYRRADGYRYKTFENDISVPLEVTYTDFAVSGPDKGRQAGSWTMTVDESSLRVNGDWE